MAAPCGASVSLAKPFSWQLKDLSVVPKLKWNNFAAGANLVQDLRLKHGNVIVFKDSSVPEAVTADDLVPPPASNRSGGGSGIKIYSYAEQVARAAAKKRNGEKVQTQQDQARQDAEKRLNAAIKTGGVHLTLATSLAVGNKSPIEDVTTGNACKNAK